jgi:8-oxo-dGTP pyrophosphatase MutT (NUDIX family)
VKKKKKLPSPGKGKPGKPDGSFVAVWDGGRLLLVYQKRKIWSLPGGGIEPGEDAWLAGIREVCEETGLRVRIVRTIAILTLRRSPTSPSETIFLLEGEIVRGKLRPGKEILKCGFFDLAWIEETGQGETGSGKIGEYQYVLAKFAFDRRHDDSLVRGELTKEGIIVSGVG